jgi:uncharacterized Zn finger protein
MDDPADHEPDCPSCGEELSHPRVTPKFGPFPKLLTFICGNCGEVTTFEAPNGNGDSENSN